MMRQKEMNNAEQQGFTRPALNSVNAFWCFRCLIELILESLMPLNCCISYRRIGGSETQLLNQLWSIVASDIDHWYVNRNGYVMDSTPLAYNATEILSTDGELSKVGNLTQAKACSFPSSFSTPWSMDFPLDELEATKIERALASSQLRQPPNIVPSSTMDSRLVARTTQFAPIARPT